jgi:ATP phosphoribosyltransferase regulatory subunit
MGIRVSNRHLPAAQAEVERLRTSGEVVIIDYLGESAEAIGCNRELIPAADGWQIVPFN